MHCGMYNPRKRAYWIKETPLQVTEKEKNLGVIKTYNVGDQIQMFKIVTGLSMWIWDQKSHGVANCGKFT